MFLLCASLICMFYKSLGEKFDTALPRAVAFLHAVSVY